MLNGKVELKFSSDVCDWLKKQQLVILPGWITLPLFAWGDNEKADSG